MKQYKFSTEIDFVGVPITLTYETASESQADKKWLKGTMADGQQINLPRLLGHILAAFGLNGVDVGFDGLGIRNIEINFDLDNRLVDFKSVVDTNELWLKFRFNFRELRVGDKEGFVFEFIPDDSESNGWQNNRLALPGGLPLIKDELKDNLYIEFSKIVVATITDPADKEIKEGLQILGKCKVFGAEQDIDIYLFGPDPAAQTARSRSVLSRSVGGGGAIPNKLTKWFDIDKTLGPFTLRKIGFQYDELVWAMVSSDFKMGPLVFSLEGLKIGFPLQVPPPSDEIEFGLNGIGLSVTDGPIGISGSFLKSSDPKFDNYYSGMALISLSEFTIDAFGGYGELPGGDKAFFIFASVNIPIGGPPFFFVKGFSLGFGYNMAIELPDIREIHAYPLLNTSIFQGDSPSSALEKLNQFIYPEAGGLWFAVGIKFTTFEIIDSSALLVIDIGKVQIAVLGLSILKLPKFGYAFVDVRLGLAVIIKIQEGILMAYASIAEDSYVIHSSCRVFGDFAFYAWSKGIHRGDFVFSLGGYHPRFNKPAHYPDLNRVGFEWRVSSVIRIGGNCYFTLTPSAVMAGFRFEAVFDIEVIKAWFIVAADFLVQWKPFHYDISMEIRMGVKVFWLKLERSVGLLIYGPPVGGVVWVDVGVAEFAIEFGERNDPKPPLLTWAQFQEHYLPPPEPQAAKARSVGQAQEEICRVNIGSGLLKKAEDAFGNEHWLVRADELMMNTESFFPVRRLYLHNGAEEKAIDSDISSNVGIRPMGIPDLYHSRHQLTITSLDDPDDPANWAATFKFNNVPEGLWATTPTNPAQPEAETIPALTGMRNIVVMPKQQEQVEETLIANFKYVAYPNALTLTDETAHIYSELKDLEASRRSGLISNSIPKTRDRRRQLMQAVNDYFHFDGIDRLQDNLQELDVEEPFQSIPRIGYIRNTGTASTREIEFQRPDVLQPDPLGRQPYFRLRKALRQYSKAFLADFTLIQEDLFKRFGKVELCIHQGATYLFDVRQAAELHKQLSAEPGGALQLLVFNDRCQLIRADITQNADLPSGLPAETHDLVIQGLPSYRPDFYACGWSDAHALPRVNRCALAGPHFVLRPQAPLKPTTRGWQDLKEVLAHNTAQGDQGTVRAYTDTCFLSREVQEVVVLAKKKQSGDSRPVEDRLRVSVPYRAPAGRLTERLYEKQNLSAADAKSVGSYIRVRYRIDRKLRQSGLLAVRASLDEAHQKYWEICGVIGLCSSGKLPANAWLRDDLIDMTCEVQAGTEVAPKLNIT